jgi:flagellar biosynthesis protein FlhF
MKLKTYTAPTMAQALAQVRKDLGTDAMILHTRSYRTGSWLGLGGKPMVEITASSPQPGGTRKSRRVKRSTSTPTKQQARVQERDDEPVPEIVVQRSRVAQPQTIEAKPVAETDVDDRAMLLQGLMGDTASPIRDRRIKSEQRQTEPELHVEERTTEIKAETQSATQTSSVEFTPTTFDRVDTFQTSVVEEQVEEPTPQSQSPSLQASTSNLEETQKPRERFLPLDHSLVFESAIPADPEPTHMSTQESIPDQAQEQVQEPVQEQITESTEIDATDELHDAVSVAPASEASENEALKAQIEALQKMMGQVLDTTRRTAVAVNKSSPDGALPPVEMSEPLHKLYTGMIDNDVSVEIADRFVGAVRDRLDADELSDDSVVRHALLREIEASIKTTSQSLLTQQSTEATGRPKVIALIGPTGVGKTTTVAKLAATAKLRHGKRVALITSDTYRIAAVEQLKTYASIIGLDIKIANSPDEIKSVIAGLNDVDLVVIDTAGRSQNNHARLDELGALIAAAKPDETHLVLSSTVGENVLRKTAERFIDLGPDRCILTKIDEAVTTGMIAGISERIGGLPLSFVTVGQEVPDDILPAKAERLARAVLDGPSAVVPQL